MKRLLAGILLLTWLAACGPVTPPAPTGPATLPPDQIVRRLATVYASPTADSAEQRATQVAARPTQDMRPPTAQPSPTVYLGVFLGVEQEDGGAPIFDPERYQGTLAASSPGVDATAVSSACTLATDPAFGTEWTVNSEALQALGCAVAAVETAVGTAQVFERGVMYFIPAGDIWALAQGGSGGAPYWHVSQAPPEQSWEVAPPEGLRMPSLGFGAVWRAVDGVRSALGFARTDETAVSLSVQRFEGGTLILDSSAGQVFVLVGSPDSGVAYGPY
jgi:hypothetical protein